MYGEGEHSTEMLGRLVAVLLVQMDDDFGIGVGGERVSPANQVLPKLAIVVDLTIEHDGDGPILIVDRLVAPFEIDDAEPPHPDAHVASRVKTVVIGPPMGDARTHALHHRGIDGSTVAGHRTNPTHQVCSPVGTLRGFHAWRTVILEAVHPGPDPSRRHSDPHRLERAEVVIVTARPMPP
jgi:hypothetical protein